MYPYGNKMTQAQMVAWDEYQNGLMDEVGYCLGLAKKARDAIVSLPHTNEEGEQVVHGCNIATLRSVSYWIARAKLASSNLAGSVDGPDERLEVDKLCKEHGIDLNGRFL